MAEDALECQLESDGKILDEDQMLVSAALHDTEAAGRLYDRYYSEILGYIYHCTFNTYSCRGFDFECISCRIQASRKIRMAADSIPGLDFSCRNK